MGYCERCGGTYDFEGICETCGTDEEWSWNTPHNQNKVVCKGCGHEIYEARRYCYICGTRNDAAFKKGENYCPKCGLAFENGVCPNCGKELVDFQLRDYEPEERGYCHKCGKETLFKDHFCMHCGNENYKNRPLKGSSQNPKNSGYGDKYAQSNRETVKRYSDDSAGWESYGNDLNTTLWLVLGILSLVLCCMPTGIGTIIYSIHAKNCERMGKTVRARRKIRTAKSWFFAGVALYVILMIAATLIQFFS